MRRVALILLTLIATPALAQTADTSWQGTNGSTGAAASSEPVQEIGFDAKTKRDPNGKKIEETTTTAAPASPEKTLRNDKKLRSDSDMLKTNSAPAATEQKPAEKKKPESFTIQKGGQTMVVTPNKN